MPSPWLTAATVVAACMAVTFALSLLLRDNSIVDITYGLAAALAAAAAAALSPTDHPRETLIALLVGLWGVRLAAHLAVRKRGMGEDFRYKAWRDQWGRWVVLRSLLQIYLLQGAVILVVLAPVLLSCSAPGGPLGVSAWLGLALWAVGLAVEATADAQLLAFKRDPGNHGRFISHGLWRYSRHPNYFGEATLWWGVFLVGLGARHGALGVVSPLVVTALLLFVSGIPMLERKWASDPAFAAYRRRTSAFVPWPPRRETP